VSVHLKSHQTTFFVYYKAFVKILSVRINTTKKSGPSKLNLFLKVEYNFILPLPTRFEQHLQLNHQQKVNKNSQRSYKMETNK